MDTLIKADIFFAITTVSVIVVTLMIVVAMVYIIMTVRTFKGLVGKLSDNFDDTSEYVKELVGDIRDSSFFSFFFKKKNKRKKKE